jgi:hypothetical protein
MGELVECAFLGCDNQFVRGRKGGAHRRRFCSVKCKDNQRVLVQSVEREAARTNKVCDAPGCERVFTPGRSDGMYCSEACRRWAATMRKKPPSAGPVDPWGDPLPHGGKRRAALKEFADKVSRGEIR